MKTVHTSRVSNKWNNFMDPPLHLIHSKVYAPNNFFVLPQELIAENAPSHSLRDASEGNCVLDNSETSTDIVDSSCDDHAQNIRSVAKNLKKRKLCLQSRNPPSKTTCLTTAVLKERREPTSVPLPANFNLPNRFRLDIQQKLDDSSSVFMAKDQSAFLREVANAIQLYSYKPSEFELANIVSEILLKYPHASSLPTAEAKHKDLIYKLKRIMERRRAELRIELSAKQKTKLRNDNHSDPTKCSQVAIDDTDETSYWKNVAKMFEIFEKGTVPYSDTVDALLKLTFSIRRALIMKWVPESGRMEKFMDKHCPFLKLQTFLFLEFELIMKKSCEIFRQKWTESAKLIVEAAKTTKKKQVAILLSSQRFQNMSPETYSRAALELLPFLVPGKGRGDKAARHLVDSRLESTNLQSCIMEERRGSPFILYIGSTIHLIMESNPFMRINTTADAVIGLMATYYVFHFKYSEKVQNALLFLQSYVFGENDKASDTCASVHSFSALLEKMKTSSF
ncbi:hypothetical protein OUZ56_002525 [Daphnia magna]|uniref:Uncharacterized protein n=1 Tax=Daphnia magna TaxID=35525 RepID=A0ABR0A5Y5_9CRUS|nr:hypothetical protein OUZ56_002525 [Daphnia magna]